MDLRVGPGRTFLKADELDEPIESILSAVSNDEGLFGVDRIPGFDTLEQHGLDQGNTNRVPRPYVGAPPTRPPLRRDRSTPHSQQPAPTVSQQPSAPVDDLTDSLSLGQLKKLVTEMPRTEPAPYAFTYDDSASFEDELEELFGYSDEESTALLRTQSTFVRRWQDFNGKVAEDAASEAGPPDWRSVAYETKQTFLKHVQGDLGDVGSRSEALECLLYLGLGCWHESAGVADEADDKVFRSSVLSSDQLTGDDRYSGSQAQVICMKNNLLLISETVGVRAIFDVMRTACLCELESEVISANDNVDLIHAQCRRQTWASLTLMCLLVDLARHVDEVDSSGSARDSILSLELRMLNFLADLVSELRWDDSSQLPSSKILLLFWKSLLLTFGGIGEVEKVKNTLGKMYRGDQTKDEEPVITASPLDYHLFRQDIISKYPAFDPPAPLFHFESDNNSMLPPLRDISGKTGQSNSSSFGAGPAHINGHGQSIIHQPVHIATPAPSPPPSPAGPGGKGIKKQNYQTNQMFPFLYPPLEDSSHASGGNEATGLQDLLAGSKWHGNDIPASILEAVDLFARRMRATRAMKQLWEERVLFMKYERGYGPLSIGKAPFNDNDLELGDNGVSHAVSGLLTADAKERLSAVEAFYKHVLPRLQSIVMVLLKVLLQTVTSLVTQPSSLGGMPYESSSPESGAAQAKPETTRDAVPKADKTVDNSAQEIDVIRSQEIMGKAVSGILILLLKWFKMSHILNFEYLAQLLLDSNYIQLVLKLFTHQDLESVVKYNCELKGLNFFAFCQLHSRHGAAKPSQATLPDDSDSSSDSDSAVPPPIKRTPRPLTSKNSAPSAPLNSTQPLPEVADLDHPSTDSPSTAPRMTFSWRNFFSNINHLRILQKIVKNKAHRQLLMVQYKYSNILKKALKVPQTDVRLYTLKIIKGQVPYCPRKWRQNNMRIITAIYLHVKPGLRDEWLAGLDVEAEVGEALPQEQALRSLTYWYHLRRYPEAMGLMGSSGGEEGSSSGKGVRLPEERDFFLRELEKMNIGVEGVGPQAVEPEEVQGGGSWEDLIQIDAW